ncbi:MAG TPA: hypothetical protein VIT91_13360 [Chthoniobacterales bacterium]
MLESWDATSFDTLGRVTGKAYNDGTTESVTYACCYLESETDRDGVTTTYSETPGGLVKTRTRFGITEITTYDAMGRLLKRIRKGTDNSEITLEDNAYNLAGELVSSKNALGRETLYVEQPGTGTTTTTTFPDGGTWIEVTAGDGTLLSVSGTAVAPVKYVPAREEGMQVLKEIKVGDEGIETEWTKTFTDMLGRKVKTVAANGAIQVHVYNVLGQLIKTIDPDNVTTPPDGTYVVEQHDAG